MIERLAGDPDVKLFVHIVTYNSARWIGPCLDAVLAQQGFTAGRDLIVSVTDNASSDGSAAIVVERYGDRVQLTANHHNLGFCGAHNQGAAQFLKSSAQFLLILNPDLKLAPDAALKLCAAIDSERRVGLATPRLYRADRDLNPIVPATIDAAGMYLTSSLRHLDRGSGEEDRPEFDRDALMFGGTGACLLITRSCVQDLALSENEFQPSLYQIYPQLKAGRAERVEIFDEAFFAYREDADLAFRAQTLGWKCRYAAGAIGYHQRLVLPERRRALPAELNLLGIRNRFLLQLNSFSAHWSFLVLINGVIIRNILVILGVLFFERSSLPALRQVWMLRRRALTQRRAIMAKRSAPLPIFPWFETFAQAAE